jgi:hypothetical protein
MACLLVSDDERIVAGLANLVCTLAYQAADSGLY